VKWLRSNWLTLILVVAVVAGALLAVRYLGLSAQYKAQKAAYEEVRRIAEADHAIQAQIVAAKEAENAALLDRNKALEGTVAANQHAMAAKDADIHKLEDALVGLEAAGDKDAVIVNLKAQVAAWSAKFSLCMANTNAKDEQIANLSAALNNQVVISDQWKQSYDQEHRLRLLAEGLVTNLEHRLKFQGFWGKLGGFAVGAGAGLLAGRLLK